MTTRSLYLDGEYQLKNPAWHVEESAWKAWQILRILRRNRVSPATVCEVGCGAGEVLKQLQQRLSGEPTFWGYDISPQAMELAKSRANERLRFRLGDLGDVEDGYFELILVLDVIEHLQDYFGFLSDLKDKGRHKIFHIPLDLCAQTVLRRTRYSSGATCTGTCTILRRRRRWKRCARRATRFWTVLIHRVRTHLARLRPSGSSSCLGRFSSRFTRT